MASVNYIGDDEDLLPPMTDEELAQMRGGVPDPGAALPVGPAPVAVAAPPIAPPPTDSGGPPPVVGPANQALAAELAKQPVLPEPKWWQRLAGAGAGAAAGYSNAAGRTRNPIDLNELSQNILAPGYGQKLAEWKSRVAPLQQAAETETARNQAWWKNAATKAGIDQKAAEAEMQRQHGKYFENRSEMEQNQWKIGAGGKLYNTITGETKDAPETPDDRFKVARALGADDEGALYYALNKKLPDTQKEKNVTESELRLRAAQGDPDAIKAVNDEANTRIRVSRASRTAPANTTIVLSDDATDRAADLYNATGTLPSLGYGNAGAAMRKRVMDRAAEKAKEAAASGNDTSLASAKADYAANSGVIKDQEKNFARVKVSEGTAERNLDLADSISKRVDRAGSPVLNKYLLYLKGQIAGDTDTQLLDNAVETAANEYAGVVTAGSGGGAATTDASRQHARDMLHSAMAKGTFSSVVAQMKREMANRRSSFEDGLKAARSNRGGKGQEPAQQPPTKAPIIPPPVSNLLGSPNVKPGIHTLSDGSKWIKNQDGTITKQ